MRQGRGDGGKEAFGGGGEVRSEEGGKKTAKGEEVIDGRGGGRRGPFG